MVLTVYCHPLSPPCRTVLAVCEKIGLEYKAKNTEFLLGESKTEEFLQLNPRGKIPVIDDDGFILWESRAIVRYLLETYDKGGALYPADAKTRAVIDRWMDEDLVFFEDVVKFLTPQVVEKLPPCENLKRPVVQYLDILQKCLADSGHVISEEWTVAEISIANTVLQLSLAGFDYSPWPNVVSFLNLYKSKPYYQSCGKA